jgi:hypothetical protein
VTRALLVLLALGAGACRKPSPPGPQTAHAPSADASATPANTAPPTPRPVRTGPVPAPSPEPEREARERAIFALLSGEHAAEALPEVATAPGEALDRNLRERLAPVTSTVRRGAASIGDVVATTPVGNSARVVAGMRAGFRACYNRTLQAIPDAKGVVDFTVSVAADGAVSAVRAQPRSKFPADALNCLTARARAAQFDPPAQGKPSQLKFAVTFSLPE